MIDFDSVLAFLKKAVKSRKVRITIVVLLPFLLIPYSPASIFREVTFYLELNIRNASSSSITFDDISFVSIVIDGIEIDFHESRFDHCHNYETDIYLPIGIHLISISEKYNGLTRTTTIEILYKNIITIGINDDIHLGQIQRSHYGCM